MVSSCNPGDYPSVLRDKLKNVPNLKSSKDERSAIIEILACIEVLKPMSYDRPVKGKHDWTYAEFWWGGDGYNTEMVEKYFGKYLKQKDSVHGSYRSDDEITSWYEVFEFYKDNISIFYYNYYDLEDDIHRFEIKWVNAGQREYFINSMENLEEYLKGAEERRYSVWCNKMYYLYVNIYVKGT